MATPNLLFPFSSPAVVVNIQDQSPNTVVNTGTNVFFPGFAAQGPTDEPTYVSDITEFRSIFGLPTTAAERYTDNAVEQILGTTPNAKLLFTRMPYGSGAGLGFSDQYNAIVFPIVGVSAVEVNACEYFRQVDEETCRVSFPYLLNANFVTSSLCYGSENLACPLASQDEQAGFLYVHNHPFQYDSVMTGFKFVVDDDNVPEDLKLFQLRPTVNGFNTTYSVVTSLSLANVFANKDEDQVNLSNDGKRLIVNLENTSFAKTLNVTRGLLSGQVLSGIFVSAGDVWGTYSQAGAPVLKFFNATSDVAGSYKTSITNISSYNAGATFTAVTTSVQSTNIDALISFCGIPVDAGISCATVTALNLQVPEKDRYTFYPLDGAAQLNDANFYVIGDPISKQLNATEYQLLENGQFNWKCGAFSNATASLDIVNNNVQAGIIIINEMKTAQLEDFSGFYVALNDNLNINPNTDFNGLTAVSSYYNSVCPGVSGNWVNVPEERLNFELSSTFDQNGSISQIVEQTAGPSFGTRLYNDSLIVTLFKLSPSRLTETINVLNQNLVEKFTGSLNATRKVQDQFGGQPRSFFLETTVNNGSNYLKMLVNPYLSENNCWNDAKGIPQKTVRMYRADTASVFDNFNAQASLQAFADKLYGIGEYQGYCFDAVFSKCQKKDIGNLPAKLERAFMEVENPITFPMDIVIDNGLSTIWATRAAVQSDPCITDVNTCYNYDDSYFVDTTSLSPYDGANITSAIKDNWDVIVNSYENFVTATRSGAGDVAVFGIVDPLRQIFVNGKDFKVVKRQNQIILDPTTQQPTQAYSTFSRNIWTYLRNLFAGVNSNLLESHANWIKNNDTTSDQLCWFPPSSFKAALFARNDFNQFPWTPAFGVTNGQLLNVVDLAINPNQRERDLLANINLNPIVQFPEGNVVFNSLTLQSADTALREDYINRGLIWLAKSIQATLRPFIGLPNTIITRTRAKNAITPLLDEMKNNSGLYDYLVICDERNNTAETIDKYIMNVAVYVKPVKAIKFVLVGLTVTETSVDFTTLLS